MEEGVGCLTVLSTSCTSTLRPHTIITIVSVQVSGGRSVPRENMSRGRRADKVLDKLRADEERSIAALCHEEGVENLVDIASVGICY